MPPTPNDECLAQLLFLHFLLQTLNISSLAHCAHYPAIFVPATPDDGSLLQTTRYDVALPSLDVDHPVGRSVRSTPPF